jgi:hypothetical protein
MHTKQGEALVATTSSRRKKGAAIAIAAVLAIAGAGAAYAYWTSTGEGTGEATTGEDVAFTITSSAAVGTIAPGNAGQTVDFTVTNPGEGTQYLTSVTVSLADEDGVAWVPAGDCLIADYVATISTAPPVGSIAAGDSVDGVATVTLTNTAVNQDDCQGQDVPLYFEAA